MSFLESKIDKEWIDIGDAVKVQLIKQEDRFLGLGSIEVDGIAVRSGQTPLRPDFSTPDAIHYQDFVLKEIVKDGNKTIIKTEAIGRPEVFGAIMDEYTHNLAFPKLREIKKDTLDWVLEAQDLELEGESYKGFSYGFKFKSEKNKIHRFTVIGTWEIDGNATGNTIYHQSYSGAPVFTAQKNNYFSTTCLKRLDLWNDWLGHSYQMLPRWGCIQPYDFTASAKGALLGYWKDPHSVKSLLQKNIDEEVIFVVDEYDFSLANEFEIPAKHMIFSKTPEAGRGKHDEVNMWTEAMDYTTQIIRDFFGIKHCYPLVGGSPSYVGKCQVPREELAKGQQDNWLWKIEDNKFYFLLEGDKIESHDFLYWVADKKLPKLHEAGLKRVWFEPVHESDFTEDCFAFHAQTGWHGDLTVCSICGSRRYVPSQFYDGWRGWNYLADKAKKLDISLGHWVGMHLTPRAPILKQHPDYIVQHANTLPFSGGYSHLSICSINWSSGAREWFLNDMRRWHEEGGLDWLFFDSWPNLACSAINYGGNMEPIQYESSKVLADLQDIGYNWFCFEGTSPFGVHQYGVRDPMEDYRGHVSHGILGQNDFAGWIGHEYMGYNQSLGVHLNDKRSVEEVEKMRFKYMSNRSLTLVQAHGSSHHEAYNNEDNYTLIYQQLQPYMQKRALLPNEQGVAWTSSENVSLLFSYKDFEYPVQNRRVLKVTGKEEIEVPTEEGILKTEKDTAYKLI
jgi:hypothetical protein